MRPDIRTIAAVLGAAAISGCHSHAREHHHAPHYSSGGVYAAPAPQVAYQAPPPAAVQPQAVVRRAAPATPHPLIVIRHGDHEDHDHH